MVTISCSICMDDLVTLINRTWEPTPPPDRNALNHAPSQDISSTPCGHVFHTKCVSEWIERHKHCPQCRSTALKSGLIKLFLSDDSNRSKSVPTYLTQGASSLVGLEERYQMCTEEHRVIKDVLQCQLEDLSNELETSKKNLIRLEDQLQEKVLEVSGLEMDLIQSSAKAEKLQRALSEKDSLLKELKNVSRINSDLMDKIFRLREDTRAKDLDLRVKSEQVNQYETKVGQIETDLRAKNCVIVELQAQLENMTRFDSNSIYESLADVPLPRPRPTILSSICSCLKAAFLIAVFLIILLTLLVVVPLTVIFSEKAS